MKLIIPSAVLIGTAFVNAQSDDAAANLSEAEAALAAWCGEIDPVTQQLVNADNSICEGILRGGPSTNPAARKLKQLKLLVLWLQPEHRFARYCYYGCWCLPDEDHADYVPRFGKPVDEVDSSCKKQAQCYDCAKMDHGDECESSDVGYRFELHKDPNDPNNHWKNSITCLDNPDKAKKACNRAVCECDKRLAEDLRTNFGFWKQGHHQTQGDFDTSMCEVDRCTGGNCQARGPVECCGNNTGPRFPFRSNFGQRGCCGDKTYDTTVQECCSAGDVRFSGAC